MNERNLWDSINHPTGLADMVHVGWVQRLLSSAEWSGFPGPEPDLVAHGQTRVGPHARKIFEGFAELGLRYVGEPTDSEPGAQRIRPVKEVLGLRKATCVDLCVAFCCAALDAGIYPLILTVTADGGQRRHAIVLVPMERQWAMGCDVLIDEGFSREPMLHNREDLRDLVVGSADDPGGTWLAIDVQQVTESDGNWKTALFLGAEYVHDWEWDVCVDVGGLRSRTPDRVLPPGGHIEKVLAPAYAELPEDFTPLQLIRARHNAVPYQQCDEIRQLREWAMMTADATAPSQRGRSGDIAVAVVTGAGGSGKTRLAAQLCDDLSTIGWYAGFLPSTTEVTDEELTALAAVTTELLVVVDYAEEARRGLVARVVRKLRARQSTTRIVLTARSADAWWEGFREEAEQDGTPLRNTLSLSIRGKQQVERDPWFFGRMYRRAVQQFSDKLNKAVPTDVEVPHYLGDTALDVVLRAWLAVCGDNDGAQEAMPTREELYDRVLSIEFARWRKEQNLGGISRDHLRRAAATLSLLAPSQDEDAVDDVLSRLPEWSQEHQLRSRFAELLVQSLLRDDGAEAVSLRPDPVAEHLILEVFGKKPELLDRVLPQDPAQVPGLDDPDAEDSVVTRALEMGQQVRNACVTLTRASSLDREVALRLARRALRERPFLWKEALDVALTQGGPLAPALEALIESGVTLPLGEIDDVIPVGHPILAGAALAATRRLAASAERSPEQQAHWANNLSIRLSDVGDRVGALVAAREAVELYRGLAEVSPAAYTPDLATSLNNLAAFLSGVGDREGALGAAREAVRLRRALAKASPQAYTPDLAASLNNLANLLPAVGERNGALEAAHEAVELYRALAKASPAAYTPHLAGSLSNLANRLSEVGEWNGALVAAHEAVRLRRALAEFSPQAYTPDLAMSLSNLANRLSAVGERNEALVAAREAVRLRRALAEASPQAYTPNLAASLNTLANILSEVGERNEALEAAREAVELYRGLAEVSPVAYTPDLAASLNNLANRLSEVGDQEGALGAAREAVELYRALAEVSPQAYMPALAGALNNLATFLSEVGEHGEALVVAREAVELHRGLAEASPQAYTPDLAMSLNNLALRLSGVGEPGEALRVAREAVEAYRVLAEASPQAYAPALARSLNTLVNCLSGVGEPGEALVVAREAVRLRRVLAEASPQAYMPALVRSLKTLARILVDNGHSEEALGAFVEGFDHLSPAARAHLLLARATWREDGREAGDLVSAAQEADTADAPALLGPVRRGIAQAMADMGILDQNAPMWAIVSADSAMVSRVKEWSECKSLAERADLLEKQWASPSISERETLAALVQLHIDLPSLAELAALVERGVVEGTQAVSTGLRIHHRVQVLAHDWREAHLNGRGASFLREHMRGNPDASRGEDQISEGDKQESEEWEKDLGDPDMRTRVLQLLAAKLPEAEALGMMSVLALAELTDPRTAYDAHGSDEGAEDTLREFLETRNWRAMLLVLGVRPSVAESTYGRIALLLFAAVTDEPVERLRELYEHANEEMDAIHRRQLQALLDKALGTDQCPPAFADILSWTKNPGPRQQ